MRVGSLVYATEQGLGRLAKSFYDHGVVTDPLVIRHSKHPTQGLWYPNRPQLPIHELAQPNHVRILERLCVSVDVMLFFETPFDWKLIDFCREQGVKTCLLTMYECTPRILPAQPDLFLCPSKLDLLYFPPGKSRFLPVPVEVPWKQRTKAEVFVHNAGHGSFRDRNGTIAIFDAIQHIRSRARLIIRSQAPIGRVSTPRYEVRCGTFPYETLWDEGDVFLFPERFNGLSLPLQEAYASGMLVMASDRFPMNTWLPKEPLIPIEGTQSATIGGPYNFFDEAILDPKKIAAKIDEWYGKDITAYSLQGREWAESMSWGKLKPAYLEVLEGLVKGVLP